jgi:hypothetical protein
MAWKRHPAALCVKGARVGRSGTAPLPRAVGRAPLALLTHTTARCRGHSARAACRVPPASCLEPLRRRRRSAPLQQAPAAEGDRGHGVEAASCRFVRKGGASWEERPAPLPHAVGRAPLALLTHTTARCRDHSAGCRAPPAACRVPRATPPTAAERAASASARGGRGSGAMAWKRHPVALCVKGARVGRSGLHPCRMPRASCRWPFLRTPRQDAVATLPRAACRVPPAACRLPLASSHSADGGGARRFSARAAEGERGHGVEAASCRFVRKGGASWEERHCTLARAVGRAPLALLTHTTARCRGHSARAACRVPPAARLEPLRRRRRSAPLQQARAAEGERGHGVEAASCRFVRKGGASWEERHCTLARAVGRAPLAPFLRTPRQDAVATLPHAACRVPPASCLEPLRRRRRSAPLQRARGGRGAGPWSGSGILPLCA